MGLSLDIEEDTLEGFRESVVNAVHGRFEDNKKRTIPINNVGDKVFVA